MEGCDRIRGPWSPEEDGTLRRLVERHGARNWTAIGRGVPGRLGDLGADGVAEGELEERPCKRASVTPESTSGSGSGSWSDRSDLSHGGAFGLGQVYRPVARAGGFEPADCAMSQRHEEEEQQQEDPFTSLSLSLPGTDAHGFHHDGSHSHFHQPSLSSSPPPAPASSTAPPTSSYPFSPEFAALMQEMIRDEVRRYISGVNCGANLPSMPQLVDGVMRAAAERAGGVSRTR
uniref:Transcription factor MYB44 n=1 Tax=Aegilops tauschii TaxID=37682 RepID=M8CD24_AEGTA